MNGCTVNIADFRCRATVRGASSSNRLARKTHGLGIVASEMVGNEREGEALQGALLQEDPAVYDIGIAREAQRMRNRMVFRPISIQRKAKVLRFNSELPVLVTMRVEEGRGSAWSGSPEGDFPPAA